MDIRKIITEICNKGLHVCVTNDYSDLVAYVPRCLVSLKNCDSGIIIISSLVSNGKSEKKYVTFYECHISKEYMYSFRFYHRYERTTNGWFLFSRDCYNNKTDLTDMINFVVTYIYYDNNMKHDSFCSIHPNINDDCKKMLRNEMVQNFSELYLKKYMYLTNKVYIEVKMVIIEMLVKLDRWNNLELC